MSDQLKQNMRRSADRVIRILALLTAEAEGRIDAFLSEGAPVCDSDVRMMRDLERQTEEIALGLFSGSARQSRIDALNEALDEIEGIGRGVAE